MGNSPENWEGEHCSRLGKYAGELGRGALQKNWEIYQRIGKGSIAEELENLPGNWEGEHCRKIGKAAGELGR